MNLAVIPARGGSVRIPRKNIKMFHLKPIIAYSIQVAQESGLFEHVIVSTDGDEIEKVSEKYGAMVIRRPKDDGVRGTQEVVAEVLKLFESEFACCIYPCAPLISVEDLQFAHRLLKYNPVLAYAVPMAKWPVDPGQFYFGRSSAFINEVPLTWAQVFEMPHERAIDINTQEDWDMAEKMYHGLHVS